MLSWYKSYLVIHLQSACLMLNIASEAGAAGFGMPAAGVAAANH